MANYVGAVRFEDGSLLYFSHQGTTEIARRPLFRRPEDVVYGGDDWTSAERAAGGHDSEVVEVMPYFQHGSDRVHFMSSASRTAMLITGPCSMEEADRLEREEERRDLLETWGRPRARP